MAREFGCSECGSKISIQFSRPGDFVTCRSCGAKNQVPELGQEPPVTAKPDSWSEQFEEHGKEGAITGPRLDPTTSAGAPPSVPLFSGEPLSVGLVLREAFRMYFAEFGRISAIATIGLVPFIILEVLGVTAGGRAASGGNPAMAGMLFIVVMPLFLVSTQISTAALTYGVFQLIRGESIEIDRCLSIGFRRFFRVLLVSVGVGLLTLIGMILCIVPGIIVLIRLSVAIPVAVVEGKTAGDALSRSRELTGGSAGVTFGVFGLLWGISLVAGLVVALLPKGAPLATAVTIVMNIVSSGLFATTIAVLYYMLRSKKESTGVEEIAAVFE